VQQGGTCSGCDVREASPSTRGTLPDGSYVFFLPAGLERVQLGWPAERYPRALLDAGSTARPAAEADARSSRPKRRAVLDTGPVAWPIDAGHPDTRSRLPFDMAYDEDLADRIRALLTGEAFVEKEMFGGLAFLISGNMSVAASGQGGLMVRVDPSHMEALLDEPGAGEVEMGNRGPMKGWLRVDADAIRDDAALVAWIRRAVEYTRAVPAKGGQ